MSITINAQVISPGLLYSGVPKNEPVTLFRDGESIQMFWNMSETFPGMFKSGQPIFVNCSISSLNPNSVVGTNGIHEFDPIPLEISLKWLGSLSLSSIGTGNFCYILQTDDVPINLTSTNFLDSDIFKKAILNNGIRFSSQLMKILDNCFHGNRHMGIETATGLQSIGSNSFINNDYETVFPRSSLIFPDSIVDIGKDSFLNYSYISFISMPLNSLLLGTCSFTSVFDGLDEARKTYQIIPTSSFFGHAGINSIEAFGGVTIYGSFMFQSLEGFDFSFLNFGQGNKHIQNNLSIRAGKISYVDAISCFSTIYFDVTEIGAGDSLFLDCNNLFISDKIQTINANAFASSSFENTTIVIDRPTNSIIGYETKWGAPASATVIWTNYNSG